MPKQNEYSTEPTATQLNNTNNLHIIIKKFQTMFQEEFEKTGISSCGHCNGTGLGSKHHIIFCTNCGGVGYKGFEKLKGQFVCRSCNGSGCRKCGMMGFVDWIDHARGNDLYKKDEK